MTYSDATPQERAALASGEARRERRRERIAREARHARYHEHPGLPEHPLVCVCDECEALRPPIPDPSP